MTAIGTITGRHGKVSIGTEYVLRTTQWAVNHTLATTSEWGDSDGGGYTQRAFGRRDATFTSEGKFDINNAVYAQFQLGIAYLSAILWMGKAIPAGTGSDYDGTPVISLALAWIFPRCLCLDINLTVDMDTEEVIGWSGSFGADGIYYRPGTAPGDPDEMPTIEGV